MMQAKYSMPLLGIVAASFLAAACREATTPTSDEIGRPSFEEQAPPDDHPPPHDQCPFTKFTGGGRIDPPNPAPGGDGVTTMEGKVTFGFNVRVNSQCEQIKGQLQVVHHPSQTKFHAGTTSSGGSIDQVFTYPSPEEGECVEMHGTIRVKHGNGAWEEHTFGAQACDNGEGNSPGTTARDTFWFRVDDQTGGSPGFGHGDTDRTYLTGGNIQSH